MSGFNPITNFKNFFNLNQTQQAAKNSQEVPAQFQQQQQQMQYQINQNPQQVYQQQYMNIQSNQFTIPQQGEVQNDTIRLLNDKQEDKGKKVVAVIVTMEAHGSYDHLFSSVEQKSMEGTRVLVYAASSFYIDNLIKAYEGNPQDDTAKQMMNYIKELEPDCVVFNWECCAAYGSQTFSEDKKKVFKFLKMIIDKGHMAMFSDFSLKSLVNQWDAHLLGPNPFKKVGETSGNFEIRFNAGDLKECPSAQLQMVGQMAQGGKCNVSAMGGTILYSVDKTKLDHKNYKLKVLSVVTTSKAPSDSLTCKIGQHKGTAGHCLLTYPSGGVILTSMGHWIELMKIDTSEKKLFQVAEKQYGQQRARQMKMEYCSMNAMQQKSYLSKNAVDFVQNQAPCSNMAYKKK